MFLAPNLVAELILEVPTRSGAWRRELETRLRVRSVDGARDCDRGDGREGRQPGPARLLRPASSVAGLSYADRSAPSVKDNRYVEFLQKFQSWPLFAMTFGIV